MSRARSIAVTLCVSFALTGVACSDDPDDGSASGTTAASSAYATAVPVSYTHLTLPTICSV